MRQNIQELKNKQEVEQIGRILEMKMLGWLSVKSSPSPSQVLFMIFVEIKIKQAPGSIHFVMFNFLFSRYQVSESCRQSIEETTNPIQ